MHAVVLSAQHQNACQPGTFVCAAVPSEINLACRRVREALTRHSSIDSMQQRPQWSAWMASPLSRINRCAHERPAFCNFETAGTKCGPLMRASHEQFLDSGHAPLHLPLRSCFFRSSCQKFTVCCRQASACCCFAGAAAAAAWAVLPSLPHKWV